jgi:hypothetical protein
VPRLAAVPDPLHPPPRRSARITYGILLAVLGYAAVVLALEASLDARRTLLRLWTLGATGMLAVVTPTLLLPDPQAPVAQLLNASPARLLEHHLRRLLPVVGLGALPAVVVAFADAAAPAQDLAAKADALGRTLLLLGGAALDTFVYYSTLGPRTQAWQEGRAGTWYAQNMEERGQGVSLPRGLVPVLFATARCFAVAIVALVAMALGVQWAGPLGGWIPLLALAGWSGRRLWAARRVYDQHFYHTNAFYSEVLGGTTDTADRTPIPYDAVYWTPHRWRPAVWASLRQLDRRFPLGRLVALGHGAFWLLCIQDAALTTRTAVLLLLVAAPNAALALLVQPTMAPPPFQRTLQSVVDWFWTRTFVNLRWLLPLMGSLGLVAVFDASYAWPWVLQWTGIALAFAVLSSLIATAATEGRARRQMA